MSKHKQHLYEFGDVKRLKRTLRAGKKAIFTGLGTFQLETDEKDNRYIKFKPDSELKNVIWEVLYYGVDRKAEDCTDIANQLISLDTINLFGFGKVYVYFDPGYFTWHDFHGEIWVDTKPRIKFLKHESFNLY